MSDFAQQDADTPLAQACAWVARLQNEPLSEDDALAFDAWLDETPDNETAYAKALHMWRRVGDASVEILKALDAQQRAARPRLGRRNFALAGGGLAAAAALAVAILPPLLAGPTTETYATGTGQHRTVRLADGSVIEMNAETRLAVTLARGHRDVSMGEGEAIFDVAPDKHRPFEIAAGGRVVRVVGTQFDVRNRPDGLAVVVARGTVQVRPGSQGAGDGSYVLQAGQKVDFRMPPARRVSAVDAAEAFAWRNGRLIYRDAPLSQVVADLNRQYPEPIRIDDPALGDSRVTGVLILDDQGEVLQRLALMLPIKAVRSERGVLLHPK